MGNAEDKGETETGTMSVPQSDGQKDTPLNLDSETVCSNESKIDESSTSTKTEELFPNTCEAMETDELETSDGPPELQPYDLYDGPDFSETFDADAFESIGLNSIIDDFDNDGRDTPELHLYDTATDEDFEDSNYSFSASGDGLMFNQDEITKELTNEGQSVFSSIRSETEEQSTECPMLLEDRKLDTDEKEVASKEEETEVDTDKDRTGDSLIEKKDNQDNSVDKSLSKDEDSLSEKNEDLEEQKQEVEKEGEMSKRDVALDTFSAILASRAITHKVLADIAAEWITHELKESMPEVFQVPTSQSTWQLLSGERIYTRERQKKMMCRRSKRRRVGVSYKESDPLYVSKHEKTKRDRRFTANPWKKTVPAVDDDGKLSCRMCKFVCDTYTAFHQHLLDHHTWKKCTNCSFLTQSQKKMNAHINIMHTPRGQWKEVKMRQLCQFCGLDAGSTGALQEHILYSHKCYICGFITKQKADLDKHMDAIHKNCPKLKPPHPRNTPGSTPGSGVPSVFVQGSSNGQAGLNPVHTQMAGKAYPLTNDMLQRQSLVQVPHRPNIISQPMSFPRASAPQLAAPRMQPINTVLGQPVPVGMRPGVVTVPQQVTGATTPMVVRLQNNANHAETYVRCTFCSYLFSTLTAAHAHMANVHWRQISALAQAGQKVILPKVILYTNNPPQHKVLPRPKPLPNRNTVKHLLHKDEHTHTSGDAVASSSIPSHQNMQTGTTTVINQSGQVPVSALGSPATPVPNIVVRHPGPAPQAIPGVVRPPVVGAVNAIPTVRQGFQTVQASPSPMTRAPVVRQQLQPNMATTLPGGLAHMAPGTTVVHGTPVAPGTAVGPHQQLLVLKKEGDKFIWVTQSAQNIVNPIPNQNKGLISVANIATANQTLTSHSTASIVTNQAVTTSNTSVKEESHVSNSSNQAAGDPKLLGSVPKHTAVTTQVTSTVVTQTVNPPSTTTTQHIVATPPSTVQAVGVATSAPTNANVQSTAATSNQPNPSPLSTIAANSTHLPGVVSINVSPMSVAPSHQVGVTPTGQLALLQQKNSQPAPKTVYFVNKAPQVGNMAPPQQVVTIQAPQVVHRVASPSVNVRGIQSVAGASNQPTTNILIMADGQRIVIPNNQKVMAVQGPGTSQPRSSHQTISLAPPVEVRNSQFVMRNTNYWRGPGNGFNSKMPAKGQLLNIGPGQTLVANSAGGVLVPTQNVKTDNSRPGRPVVLSLAPKPEPKSDNKDSSVVNKGDKSKHTPVVETETASAAKGTPQIRDKNKKAKGKNTTGKQKNNLLKKKQKKAKTERAEEPETMLLRSFHSNPYLTSRELQQLKFKTYRSASDIRYWFHTMQRKCMKSLEQREPRVFLCRCDAKRQKVKH
ncbi:ZFAT [Branchiostoma lanceolatum]|uniref:ZFAT protein n=1 Tax=Branchiostoma lanceolatum TaxID=7740 RepID=A0A8K0A7D8_BRALA|nr:ZFAT [Branchiostoma lanceolatum]